MSEECVPGRCGIDLYDSGRRAFLSQAMILLGLAGRSWAQTAATAPRYLPLTRTASVPLSAAATPWQRVSFEAEGQQPPVVDGEPGWKLPLKGVLFRVSPGGNNPDNFLALSLRCSHSGCEVEYVEKPSEKANLPALKDRTEPVFWCPCHNSVFAGTDGARLAGAAPRGMYRFRTVVRGDVIEMNEVEEDVLLR